MALPSFRPNRDPAGSSSAKPSGFPCTREGAQSTGRPGGPWPSESALQDSAKALASWPPYELSLFLMAPQGFLSLSLPTGAERESHLPLQTASS